MNSQTAVYQHLSEGGVPNAALQVALADTELDRANSALLAAPAFTKGARSSSTSAVNSYQGAGTRCRSQSLTGPVSAALYEPARTFTQVSPSVSPSSSHGFPVVANPPAVRLLLGHLSLHLLTRSCHKCPQQRSARQAEGGASTRTGQLPATATHGSEDPT